MIKILSKGIVYVSGPKNSAIYDFEKKKVYSIKEPGTKIINSYCLGQTLDEQQEKDFIKQIQTLFQVQEIQTEDFIFGNIPEKSLQFVWLEVTQSCPFRCIHCYEGSSHIECKNPLKYDEWINIIDDLSSMNVKEIRFIGGEPTVYKSLYRLIDYAGEKKIEKISVFSNLYFVNDNLLNSIVKNNVEVHFSIYAADEKKHDSITQVVGSFEKLMSNLKLFTGKNIKLVAHVVIIKENQDEVDNIYKLLAKLGINNIKYDEFRKVYGVCDDRHVVTKSRIANKKPNFKTSKEQFELSNFVNTCWFGKCVISSDGNVFPCEMERNHLYGNVRNLPIKDIITSNVIDKFWYLNFGKIKGCTNCELRFACRDCRPLAYANNGDLYEKNPRCKYNPEEGTWN